MKIFLNALLALSLFCAPAALAQQPDEEELPAQTPVMMDIVRLIIDQAREGRLEQLMPRQEQLRGLEGVLRPDENGYGLASEFLKAVRPSPEQEEAMRNFRLSQDQMFAMLDYVMDRGNATRPQDLDQFLTREQQATVDGLQLSSEQIDTFERLLSQQILPMMENLQGRVGSVGQGVELNSAQSGLFQMLLQLLPPPSR